MQMETEYLWILSSSFQRKHAELHLNLGREEEKKKTDLWKSILMVNVKRVFNTESIGYSLRKRGQKYNDAFEKFSCNTVE